MSPVKQSSRVHHRVQVARARRYLRTHAMADVSLAAVARAAGASPYHFARLYHAMTGETVFGTLTRVRVELAAAQLGEAPARAVSAIALEVGYATPSAFNKAFRAVLGVSPTEFRGEPVATRRARVRELAHPARRLEPLAIALRPELRHRGATRVAFVREHGGYGDISAPLAWAKLDACLAGADAYTHFDRIGVAHDDPRTVVSEALRYDAGLVIAADTPVPRGTTAAVWPGGLHAVFEHRGPYRLIEAAFDAIARGWILRTQPRLRPAPFLELYRNSPVSTPEAELLTELWIPIEGTP
jgi:AraC family transcriptional regulator